MEYSLMVNMPAAPEDPLKGKKTGKWTKYGGAISGLMKERIQDHWYCQICAEEIPEEIKPFLLEQFPGDFLRLCPRCTNTASRTRVEVRTLIRIMRVERG